MKRWNIINQLIEKFDYTSYLEVGTQNPNSNFNKIRCNHKISVEPFPKFDGIDFIGTSDDFFEQLDEDVKYDMIFIDGLHHYDQVLVDIDNSLKHLSDNGSILCHDCLPTTERMQSRDDNGGEWTGDVWKAMFIVMRDRPDINLKVIDTDYGCGLIRKEPQNLVSFEGNLTYDFYEKSKKKILNIISPKEFEEWISGR